VRRLTLSPALFSHAPGLLKELAVGRDHGATENELRSEIASHNEALQMLTQQRDELATHAKKHEESVTAHQLSAEELALGQQEQREVQQALAVAEADLRRGEEVLAEEQRKLARQGAELDETQTQLEAANERQSQALRLEAEELQAKLHVEDERLREKLAELNAREDHLNRQAVGNEHRTATLEQREVRARDALKVAESRLAEAAAAESESRRLHVDAQAVFSGAREQKSTLDAQAERQEEAARQLETQASQSDSRAAALDSRAAELERGAEELRDSEEELRAQAGDLGRKEVYLAGLEEVQAKEKAGISEKHSSTVQLLDRAKETEAQAGRAQAALDRRREELERSERTLADDRAALGVKIAALQEWETALDNKTRDTEATSHQLRERSDAVEELRQVSAAAEERVQASEEDLRRREESLGQMHAAVSEMEVMLDGRKRVADEAEHANVESMVEAQRAESRLQQWEATLRGREAALEVDRGAFLAEKQRVDEAAAGVAWPGAYNEDFDGELRARGEALGRAETEVADLKARLQRQLGLAESGRNSPLSPPKEPMAAWFSGNAGADDGRVEEALLEERKKQLRQQEAEVALEARRNKHDAAQLEAARAKLEASAAAAAGSEAASSRSEAELALKFRELTEQTVRLRQGERMLADAQVTTPARGPRSVRWLWLS
jgi:hypothetical protein